MLVTDVGFIFAHFVYKGGFGQIWLKITESSVRFEILHFDVHFTNYGVPFLFILNMKKTLA